MAPGVPGDQAMKAGFGAEMEEESDLEIGGAEVVVELAPGGRVEKLRRLHFDDEAIVDQHVEALGTEQLALVRNTNRHFQVYLMTTRGQLSIEREDIDVLEKPIPKGVVHFVERTNH